MPRRKSAPKRQSENTPRRRADRAVETERIVALVPSELAARLRVHCASEPCSVSYAVEEALAAYLKRRKA